MSSAKPIHAGSSVSNQPGVKPVSTEKLAELQRRKRIQTIAVVSLTVLAIALTAIPVGLISLGASFVMTSPVWAILIVFGLPVCAAGAVFSGYGAAKIYRESSAENHKAFLTQEVDWFCRAVSMPSGKTERRLQRMVKEGLLERETYLELKRELRQQNRADQRYWKLFGQVNYGALKGAGYQAGKEALDYLDALVKQHAQKYAAIRDRAAIDINARLQQLTAE